MAIPEKPGGSSDMKLPFPLVERFEWGAKLPKFFGPLEQPLSYLVVEVTGTHRCLFDADCVRVMRHLQEAHMEEEGVPDIKYNFCIGGNGKVYEGRGWFSKVLHTNPERTQKGWEAHDWNGKAFIIAYIAPYDEIPSMEASLLLRDIIGEAIRRKFLKMDFLRIPGFFTKPP